MNDEQLTKNAGYLVDIITYYNDISKLLASHSIASGRDLARTIEKEPHVKYALCSAAKNVYEKVLAASCIPTPKDIGNLTAELSHPYDRLEEKKKMARLEGLDNITPQRLWDIHLEGAVKSIIALCKNKLESHDELRIRYNDLTSSHLKPALKVKEISDYGHLSIIQDIQSPVQFIAITAVALLRLMSSGTIPTVDIIYKTIQFLNPNVTEAQILFVLSELCNRNMLRWSDSSNYVFIVDESFAVSAMGQFLEECERLDEIIDFLGEVQ
jgi:hypothetical protein